MEQIVPSGRSQRLESDPKKAGCRYSVMKTESREHGTVQTGIVAGRSR